MGSVEIAAAGAAVGFLVGLTGMGGGAIMTPFLVLVVGVDPLTAVGTDLVFASATKVVGAWRHARQRTIDWRLVGWLAAGSLPGAATGAAVLASWQAASLGATNTLVGRLLGATLLVVAVVHAVKAFRGRRSEPPTAESKESAAATPAIAVSGFVVGFLVMLTSVGSGSLLLVALTWVAVRKLPVLVGTDVAHALLLSVAAAAVHASLGNPSWGLAGNLLIGSIPGVWVGSWACGRAPERLVRAAVAAMLLVTGWKLV